eukprot:11242258-Karenia_brevis.AAC.1
MQLHQFLSTANNRSLFADLTRGPFEQDLTGAPLSLQDPCPTASADATDVINKDSKGCCIPWRISSGQRLSDFTVKCL